MFLERMARNARITDSGELAKIITGSNSSAGVIVTPESAMRASAVYACVRVLSESVAQLPLFYYKRSGERKEKATDQRLYSILHDAPNNFQTSFEFRETQMMHLCLKGKAFAFINRSITGDILELLPMRPESVELKQAKDFSLSYVFTDSDGNKINLRQDQVFRLTGMSFDGINGVSPIAFQRESIGISLATDKHTALSFKNGAKMTGILKHPSTFKDKEVAKRVKESWDDAASGDNAYRTPVLEDGMDWMPVSMSNKDAQYIESRKFNIEDIARIFRVPPHKIGHLEKATFSNIEHLGLSFVTDSLVPWLVRWEQAITRDLILPKNRSKYFAEFSADGIMRGDQASRAAFYNSLWMMGALNPNEIRAKENMNPREDEAGNEYVTPLNMGSGNAQVQE